MILSKVFITKLIDFMEKNPKVGIVKGKQALIPGKNFLATLETYSRAVSRMVNYESEKACLKSLGTGGSIYRIEAIKQVGGFDENLKGYGEDYDIEIRVRKKGWVLSTTDVKFRDYERHELTWKKLWLRYFKRGYDQYSLMQKHKGAIDLFKMLPFITFIAGLFHSLKIYKITRNKIVFLLPLQYIFKTFAWYYGFVKANNNL